MTEAKITGLPPEKEKIPEKFSEMLASPNFRKALALSAAHTREKGLEAGFDVDLLPDGSFWIDEVRGGGTGSMDNGELIAYIDEPRNETIEAVNYFGFHIHTVIEDVVVPSPDDLDSHFSNKKKFADLQSEFMGIGQMKEKGKMKVLVVSKPKYGLADDDLKFYEDELDRARELSQEDVRLLLSTIGLSSLVIKMRI